MKKEQIITSAVMLVVSVLVLISVTIAWYTGNQDRPTVTGMQMSAAEVGEIKIALAPGGEDILVLQENNIEGDEYADIGLEELINIESGKIAPGAFGKVTFYITPLSNSIKKCVVTPSILLQQGSGDWYSGEESETTSTEGGEGGAGGAGTLPTTRELYEITKRHIEFFIDDTMTTKVTDQTPCQILWGTGEEMQEKAITIYWKWHYEYPFSAAEESSLSQEQQKEKIDLYDQEDTKIGNYVTNMKFRFKFLVQ